MRAATARGYPMQQLVCCGNSHRVLRDDRRCVRLEIHRTAPNRRKAHDPRACLFRWSEACFSKALGSRPPRRRKWAGQSPQDVCGAGLMIGRTAPSRLAQRAASKARLTGGVTVVHHPGGIGAVPSRERVEKEGRRLWCQQSPPQSRFPNECRCAQRDGNTGIYKPCTGRFVP
jgi:hypothetical protein